MKKLITILLVLISLSTFSQKVYDTYESSYFNKTYDIKLSYKDSTDFIIWIKCTSLDKIHSKDGEYSISYKQYEKFINSLQEAKQKYIEWVKTAKENNVKDLLKHMDLENKCKVDAAFIYGDWQFQFDFKPKFDFMILDGDTKVKYLLLIKSGELVSSSNQFMKVDGIVIVLSSVKEIEDLLNKISLTKIKEIINKPKTEDLFK